MTGSSHDFRAVYDEHFASAWRMLRRCGVAEADLPDAAQEVFLVVHRRLGDFAGRSALRTWIFGIAVRVAQGRRNLAHVRREVATDAALIDERLDAEVHAIAASRADPATMGERLEQCLAELPIEQRLVFVLFELEELSGEQIAELLGAPVGTVRSRLRLARQAVRRSASRWEARERGSAREARSR